MATSGLPSVVQAAKPAPAKADFTLFKTIGVSRMNAGDGAYLIPLGVDGLFRWRLFAAGLGGDWKSILMVRHIFAAHGLAGLSIPVSPLRIDVLGVAGVRYYFRDGFDLLTGDPGVSATLPYAGARLRVTYEVLPRETPLVQLGLSFGYDDDLSRHHADYTYTHKSILSDSDPYQATTHREVGSSCWTLALTAGASFRLL